MINIGRRQWLAGASAALAVADTAWAREAAIYDYLFLDFDAPPGARPYTRYAEQVAARAAAIEAEGGRLIGLFTPQLGWRSGEGALLVEWRTASPAREALMTELSSLPGVRAASRERLSATARPAAGSKLQSGGIYVHRWFLIDAASLDEVVSLSTQAWPSFETMFESRIFGLLKAAQTPEETAQGRIRLLLLTRYSDHGVWEASRDPSEESRDAFVRRQKLTHRTWAASTLVKTFPESPP